MMSNPSIKMHPLGLQTDFTADVVLKTALIKELSIGDQVNVNGSNVLTCAGKTFGSLKVGDILVVNLATDAAPRFNRVSAISADLKQVTLAAVPSVTGVCVGTVLSSHQSALDSMLPDLQLLIMKSLVSMQP